jgi:glycosyltransferase involved in cell wall biosynthesis
LALIEAAAQQGADLSFLLLTATPIREYVQSRLSEQGLALLSLEIRDQLTDGEINRGMARSRAVLLMHRHISQSGVLPVAYLNDTPVIARDLPGFRQHIEDGVTGRLVNPNPKPSDWLKAANAVAASSETMKGEPRRKYEEEFSPEQFDRYYQWLNE